MQVWFCTSGDLVRMRLLSLAAVMTMALCVLTTIVEQAHTTDQHRNYSKPRPKDAKHCYIQWLHPPKTSSTFCLTLQHACNETQFFLDVSLFSGRFRTAFGCWVMEPHGTMLGSRYHHPLSIPKDLDELHRFVTMLRHPDDRLISAFLDGMHMEGVPVEERQAVQEKMVNGARGNRQNSEDACVQNFNIYANYPANHACYTKMLNGFKCHANIEVTQEMVTTAKKHLDRFLFVGIFEHYMNSTALFLEAVSQTNPTVHPQAPMEHFILRAGTAPCKQHMRDYYHYGNKSYSRLHGGAYRDTLDGEVYEHALKLFDRFRQNYTSAVMDRQKRFQQSQS